MAGDALQKFKSSLNRGVTTLTLKTSSSLEKVKIKTHIDSINAEIETLIVNIGENAYELWENQSTDYAALNTKCEQIKQKIEARTQLETEFESIDERDSEILGANAEKTVDQSAASSDALTCSGCGEVYQTAAKFCRKCGTPLA